MARERWTNPKTPTSYVYHTTVSREIGGRRVTARERLPPEIPTVTIRNFLHRCTSGDGARRAPGWLDNMLPLALFGTRAALHAAEVR